MRKKLFTIILLTGISGLGFTQQRPHYTQYILNNFVLNPALAGIENYTDLKLSYRDQWVGLDGAPKTFYLTIHGPLGKKDYKTSATSYNIPGQNPRGESYWESYTASEPHHGIGLTVMNDKTGLYNRFTANVSYAYHLGLNATTNLAGGFSAGITRIGYDFAHAKPGDLSQPLFIYNSTEINKVRPDINFGLWLYSADYFVGVSAQQIVPQRVKFSDDASDNKLVPHFFATAGYRFLINDDINAIPSVMVKYVSNTPTNPQYEGNIKFQYRDLVWVGGSYMHKVGYAAMIGLNVANTFNVGYSFDITRNRLNEVSSGTHELVIGFLLGNRYGDTCPRNVW